MGKRRRRSYVPVQSSASKQSARVHPFPILKSQPKPLTIGYVHKFTSYLGEQSSSFGLRTERKAHEIRTFIQKVVWISAICVCPEVLMGYFVILEDQDLRLVVRRDCLKAGVCLLSLIQVAIIVYYWKAYVEYLEAVQLALSPGSIDPKGLWRSPKMIGYCIVETLFYLLTFYPGLLLQIHQKVAIFEWSSDDFAYILILFRGYQAGRLLYWLCPFSNMRTHIFTRVTTVEHNSSFVMRCFVARYGFLILAIVSGYMVLVSGIIEFVFEQHNTSLGMDVIWNDFWLVAYTLTTIGYGNVAPKTLSGQGFIIVCTLFGALVLGFLTTVSRNSLDLSLRESEMCSDLIYRRSKGRYAEEAAVTLQRWWGLMKMRLCKKPHGPTILRFYTQLRQYRSTLVACRRVKNTLFEGQLAAFDHSTHTQIRSFTDYLQPALSAFPLLQDIYRSEYHIKFLCREVAKLTNRYKIYISGPHLEHIPTLSPSENDPSSSSPVKTRFRLKAKRSAYQNVVGRLVKEEV